MTPDEKCPHDLETLPGMVRCVEHTAEAGRAIDPVYVLRLVRFHERITALADELEEIGEEIGGKVCWEVAQILREALEEKERA